MVEEEELISNLFALSFNPLEDGFISAGRKATLLASLLIVLVSCTEPLRPKVKGVSKGLVDTVEDISTSHEHLTEELSR
jgi:hypothetical protein